MPLPSLPTWSQTKTGAKAGFDKVYHVVDKLGPPVNKLSNKLGAEAFWPTTLDKESDKAARILRSFCKDGFYVEEKEGDGDGGGKDGEVVKEGVPRGKQRVIKKIPMSVIKEARGIAIFTTMRTGLWFSGAGGAGVIVAKMPDGSWSPPSVGQPLVVSKLNADSPTRELCYTLQVLGRLQVLTYTIVSP